MSLAIGKTRKPKKLEESTVDVSAVAKVVPKSSKKEGRDAKKKGQKTAAGQPCASIDVDKHESLVTAVGNTPHTQRTRTEDQKPVEQNPEETKKRARTAVLRFKQRRERNRAKRSVPESQPRLPDDERRTAERPTRKANADFARLSDILEQSSVAAQTGCAPTSNDVNPTQCASTPALDTTPTDSHTFSQRMPNTRNH